MAKNNNIYSKIIEKIFLKYYTLGDNSFIFKREDIEVISKKLKISAPKNLGDLIYSYRYRKELPEIIKLTAPEGMEWIISPAGIAQYKFELVKINRIIPRERQFEIKIPNATPEIILKYAQGDEQALLAIVRYNRLIDIFLGISTYSLQNHLRTNVKGIGQIEIDEIYVGIDKLGRHFIIPVQAKGGSDQLSVIQPTQDIEFCKQKYPELICRSVAAQFINDTKIAMFELLLDNGELKIVDEKHYCLVQRDQITADDLKKMSSLTPE